MDHLNHLINNKKTFFNFMNENYTIFQYSNLFLRDLQYAIMSYFEMKEEPLKYSEAENIAVRFISDLLSNGDITKIDYKSWRINFEVGKSKKEVETEGAVNE